MRRALVTVAAVAAALALAPGAALAVTAKTIRVSVSSAEAQGNGNSGGSAISANGRIVAFTSDATNLVGRDTNGVSDIFVRNRTTGKTRRVSLSSSEAQANGASWDPDISGDGRYVVFVSEASNLVPGDTNGGWDIFIRNRETGKTRRLSVSSAGAQANGDSSEPSISRDGDHVAFTSWATNLASGVFYDQTEIFVRDRSAGKTRHVSVTSAGAVANHDSYEPSISGDGNVVAFTSEATNLAGEDANGSFVRDVFVRVRSAHKTRLMSVSSAEVQGNGSSVGPAVSASGRFVAFASQATNLVDGDSNSVPDVFVRDRLLGQTRRVSISSAEAQGNAGSAWGSAISADGRSVAFSSDATNLVGMDTNDSADVFVRDRSAGTTRRVSVRFDGTQANEGSYSPEIAGRGRFVAFSSDAANLVAGDTNTVTDVFVRGPLY